MAKSNPKNETAVSTKDGPVANDPTTTPGNVPNVTVGDLPDEQQDKVQTSTAGEKAAKAASKEAEDDGDDKREPVYRSQALDGLRQAVWDEYGAFAESTSKARAKRELEKLGYSSPEEVPATEAVAVIEALEAARNRGEDE